MDKIYTIVQYGHNFAFFLQVCTYVCMYVCIYTHKHVRYIMLLYFQVLGIPIWKGSYFYIRYFVCSRFIFSTDVTHLTHIRILYVLINQRDATLLINGLCYPLVGSTCFGLSPVHHQEHHLINCKTYWYIRAIRLQQLDSPDSTNIPIRFTVYEMMLLMMYWW